MYVAATRAKNALYLERNLANRFNLTHILQASDDDVHSGSHAASVTESERYVLPAPALNPMQRSPQVTNTVSVQSAQRSARPGRSLYKKYGDFAIGISIGLIIWLLAKW